jgi:hypothetical protein
MNAINTYNITKQDIINFTFSLCLNNEIEGDNINIPSQIQNFILNNLP